MSKHIYNTIIFTVLVYFGFLSKAVAQQPNFVIIMLDDQGWTGSSVQMDADLSTSKSDYYVTANLETLASSGMVFSRGYAPAPKCAPSRNSILTGMSTARNSFTSTDNNIAEGKVLIEATTETIINNDLETYAEWLKNTGLNYRTAHFGKWHLGNTDASDPAMNGFDSSDGNTNNSSGNTGTDINDDPKKIFDLTSRSIAFMQNAVDDGVPFSLQLSHYAVHTDVETRQSTLNRYNDPAQRPKGTLHDNAEYGAMTEDTDDGVGLLLQALTNLGIDDNTYVFYLSDNGGQMNLTDNAPLNFGKTFIFEGGIRVPFIVCGPGISAKTYSSEPVVAYDLFPTIAELTGSDNALPNNLDGQSIVPLLRGESFERQKPLFFHSPHYDNNARKTPRSAVIAGDYKLIAEYETGSTLLFDLEEDISESNDLSVTKPDVRDGLRRLLRDHLKSVQANMPTLNPAYDSFTGSGEDIDSDGLPDSWELSEMLSHAYGPEDDPDNDGRSNLIEYQQQTDPLVDENAVVNSARYPQDPSLNVYVSNGKLVVSSDLLSGYKLRLFDLNGKEQMVMELSSAESMDVSYLNTGLYLVQITSERQHAIRKLLIN